jgi:hypothetical protein
MHLVDDATSTALFSFGLKETTWTAARAFSQWVIRGLNRRFLFLQKRGT